MRVFATKDYGGSLRFARGCLVRQYSLDFNARGWDARGEKPFTDLMSITDVDH